MNREIEILEKQNFASLFFILSIILSMVLTYDEKQHKLHRQSIFSENADKYVNLGNRILSLSILFYIFYLNWLNYKIGKEKGRYTPPLRHQVEASIVSIISGLIVLYVVLENWESNPNITNIENPTL